ncbi:sortase [Streptomyces sp. NBC_00199]|uniref:sortase n=1 Tax=Streptomyces sp. NBC_00199 TaxID=2975678 RepID=UPI0022507DBA|nr:sortase [Streptomyces sp. NBC_00199]MCX5264792.1 sortase [Streptomyces sp. NBC_00199]
MQQTGRCFTEGVLVGNTRVGIGIGLVAGILALQVPVAAAAGDSGLDIRSRQTAEGSTVTVSTTACGPETYGKGESEAAGAFHLFGGETKGVLTGEFTVPEGTSTDTVMVKCPPRIMITDSYRLPTRRPDGAVEAGFGDTGEGASQLALGAALVGAAAAGMLVRRRHRATPRGD